ncbi:DUF3084 domain-containing protein [Pectinatus sottacetonis]|uniref:DUF3084 domain-containing protein n=1 Tax=Pectinatus sottacetonis TaxID=1002795 RepID=UPI0018C496BC|nr:DUF3084 domain-containing protein [Pectinatus sottacetonis]
MYGIVLIVILVIVGGMIAFIGDRLGSKVGKKRMSLFGLRPRHTSIIVTIITGIAITTMTLGILAVTSKNVRTALFGMEKLQEKIQITQNNLNTAQNGLKVADADLKKAKIQQTKMHMELTKTNDALSAAQRETKKMQKHQLQLLADNDKLEEQNVFLDNTNEALQNNNDDLKNNNDQLQKQNDDLLKRNGDLSNKKIIYQAGELIFGGIVSSTTDRAAAQSSLSKLITIANTKVAIKSGESVNGKTGIWIYPSEYEDAIDKICSAKTEMVIRLIAAANLVKGEPVRTNIELYPDKIVYYDGEVITNGEFILNGTKERAQQVLLVFLHDINKIASANGILPDPLRGSIGVINMEQLYNVTDVLSRVNGKIIITAYSRGNTDILGPLHLTLKVEELQENE